MTEMKLGIVFDVKNSRFKSEVKESTQVIQKLGTSHQVAAGKSRQLSNELTNTEQKLFRTNKVAQAVTLSLASMATGFSVGLLFKNLSDTTQKFQVLRATLETATGGVDEAGLAFDRLQVFASKTPFSVEESIQAFIKLKNLGLDPTESALNSYGNTASAMGKSLDQFIEAVADASVSEFERLKEFGIKAKNQGDTIAFTFRKMKTEVANNAEAIEQYLQNLGENEFAGAMERQAATYDGALSNMGDSWDQLLLKISDDGAGDAMENVVRGITANLDLLGNNTQAVADVFQFGLVVATGHAVNALSNKSAAIVKDTVATQTSNRANLALAKTELAQAATANQRAIQEQAAAQRMLKNAQNATIRSKAITNLARANGQLAASEKLVALATNNVAIATNKANVARRAGAAALGLLGGPAGVAMLAAYAIGSYAMSAADAARESVNLADKIGLADKKLTELSTKQLNLRLFNLDNDPAAEIDKARLRALKAQEEYNKVQAKRGFKNPNNETDKTVLNRDVEIEALEAKLAKTKELKEKIKELLATPSSSSVPGTESKKPKPEVDKNKKEQDKVANDLSQVEKSLYTKEEAIKASYLRRQTIIDTALMGKKDKEEKYNQLSLALELQKDAELKALAEEKQANEQKLREEKVQAELNARELLDQHRRDAYAAEIAELNGFHVEKEDVNRNHKLRLLQEERDHQDAKRDIQLQHTGQYGQMTKQFVALDRASGADRVSIAADIGGQITGEMAKHSKKAFALNKAFNIAKAMVNTFTAATTALAELGPIAGPIAAGAITAMGLMNVSAIARQKPQGFESGGRIGQSQNIIEFGERNKPEVLEFGGQNYLLGGNGGAVFNRSQLQPVGGSSVGSAVAGTTVNVNLIEDASKAGQVSQSKGLNNEDVIRIFVADIRQGGDSADAMELTYGVQRTGT